MICSDFWRCSNNCIWSIIHIGDDGSIGEHNGNNNDDDGDDGDDDNGDKWCECKWWWRQDSDENEIEPTMSNLL